MWGKAHSVVTKATIYIFYCALDVKVPTCLLQILPPSPLPHLGVKTLADCLSLDTSALSYHTDSHTLNKFKLALPSLELVVWLQQWHILDYRPVLEKAGYSSQLLALCDVQLEKAKQVQYSMYSVGVLIVWCPAGTV